MSSTLLLVIALAAPPGPTCPGSPPLGASLVVAEVNGKRITVADLDREIADDICGAQLEYRQKLHGMRANALERLVNAPLLEAEAKRRGLKNTEALMQVVVAEAPDPDAKAIRAFYDQNQARMRGMPFEEVKEAISDHLDEQAAQLHVASFVTALREKNQVKVDLPPIRIEVAAVGASRGPVDAPITIIEFADYECPYCAKASGTVAKLMKRYPGKIRHVFRDYPLGFHQRAVPAAVAARCAGAQGKYWEMHDALFTDTQKLDDAWLDKHAQSVGLDLTKFVLCRQDPKHTAAVGADFVAGQKAGVNGTPAFFVNGVLLSGAMPEENFIEVIEPELRRLGKL